MKKQKANKRKSNVEKKSQVTSIESSEVGQVSEDVSQGFSKNEKSIQSLILETFDGRKFKVDANIAKMFLTLKSMMEDSNCEENAPVKLGQISGPALEKMIAFAELHVNDPPIPEELASKERKKFSDLKEIDSQFVKTMSHSLIFEMILAANFLDFQLLLDVLCKSVANLIKSKNVEEIRTTFNIVNDFTPQEEEKLRQENAWAEKS